MLFVLVVGTIPFNAPYVVFLYHFVSFISHIYTLEHDRYTTERAYQILCQNVDCVTSSKELIKLWRKSCLERVASNSTNSSSSSSSTSHTPISNDLLDLMCSLMSHEYTRRTRTLRDIFESSWIQRMLRLEENENSRRIKQIVSSIRQSLDKIT